MEILGVDRFRVNALARAARSLESLTVDVADIGPDVKELSKIEGVGKGTAQRIAQFLDTGKIDDHQELLDQLPPGLLDLMNIQGLGPKKISLLWNEAEIESLNDLKAKLDGDELASLPGMGKKTLENLRKNIAFAEESGGRANIGVALPLALWFVDQLGQLKPIKKVTYAGSLRRGRETIGDLDLLVAASAKDARAISDAFVKLEPVADVQVQGETKTSIRTGDGVQVDLRIVEPKSFGAALMYFTGSKEHNVRMRERAIRMGMSLNEYALTKDGNPVAGKTENEVYKALKLTWVEPELREDRGELALAESSFQHKAATVGRGLPDLLTLDDIKAELHAHTTASDGRWSIRKLALAAADRGFHTVAVTDHSKGQAQANGLDNKRLEQHIKDVREVAAELKDAITVLAGSEVDILSDGKLDYPNSLLKDLDIVVASPHAALSQDPKTCTKRLLRAIENPYVTILGHPTGRLIGRREGLSPDMSALIQASGGRGIAMEINAHHLRLDLRDTHARAAIEAGVKLSINTDAHDYGDMDQLIFGVLTARRAGATVGDVVNCMTKSALAKWIRATRS